MQNRCYNIMNFLAYERLPFYVWISTKTDSVSLYYSLTWATLPDKKYRTTYKEKNLFVIVKPIFITAKSTQ